MSEELQMVVAECESEMKKSLQHLEEELQKIRAGKASAAMLDGISVDYYGNATPLNQVANISATDAKTLVIQPWEKATLQPIEKAILSANIGLTPMNDGEIIRLVLPPLTEERRRELVKSIHSIAEHCKVSLRNHRRQAHEEIKRMQKEGLSEDDARRADQEVDAQTKKYGDTVDKYVAAKEEKVMTV